jgi:hypothetical protein
LDLTLGEAGAALRPAGLDALTPLAAAAAALVAVREEGAALVGLAVEALMLVFSAACLWNRSIDDLTAPEEGG